MTRKKRRHILLLLCAVLLLYECRTGTLDGFPQTAVSTESEKDPSGRSSRSTMAGEPLPASILEEKFPLLVEEYKIVSAAEDSPGRFEYDRRIGDAILAKRRTWRAADMIDDSVTRINEAISPLGYKLVQNAAAYPGYGQPIYDLVCNVEDSRPCVANLQNVHNFRMNEEKTSFVFVASQRREEGTPYVLIRDGRVLEWNEGRYAAGSPILLGDSLMAVEKTLIEPGKTSHNTLLYQFCVLKDGENVFEFKAKRRSVSGVVKRFLSCDGSWILEYENHVVRDGDDVGQAKGYDAVFDYCMIAGKPFYFFVRGGKTCMAYGDRVLPQVYEEVIHYKCCEPAHFNPRGNENMVWFHARRDGYWYYVEAGVYGQRKRKPVERVSQPEATHPPARLGRSPRTNSPAVQRRRACRNR